MLQTLNVWVDITPMRVQQNHCLFVFRQTVVTHNFFRKLTTAQRNTARAPSYDFQRLNNKSLTKGARAVSGNIVSVDEGSLRKDIKNLMKKTVEKTLNALLSPHAGDGEAEVHSEARAGQEEVPGHIQTGGDGRAEGKGGRLEEDGAEDG